jgi:hypothetical protein
MGASYEPLDRIERCCGPSEAHCGGDWGQRRARIIERAHGTRTVWRVLIPVRACLRDTREDGLWVGHAWVTAVRLGGSMGTTAHRARLLHGPLRRIGAVRCHHSP